MKKFNLWLWIIIIVIILLAIWVYYGQFKQTSGDQVVDNLLNVSQSDEVGAIEQDLADTNLDNLDQELNNIEQEINSIQ